mmetsp:Transcript_2311/g.3101  ORF Transcript_2311/g.3101 Transcript_2311/m.3101 type:complete len:164 (+) Transcript_2311:89-580(+)
MFCVSKGLSQSFRYISQSSLKRASLSKCNYPKSLTASSSLVKFQSLAMSTKADLLCVHVFVTVKPGTEDQFKEASLANARESSKEEGVSRFDVIQQIDDPCKFVLVEVYNSDGAPAAHKETNHYKAWRETVADMMAVPRSAIKYNNLFPSTSAGWEYGEATLE